MREEMFTKQGVCDILCEGCERQILLEKFIPAGGSKVTYHHRINDEMIPCRASEWRRIMKFDED